MRFKENRISESNTPDLTGSAMPGGAGGVFVCRILPDSQHMPHEQAHGSDADPAAKAQGERFTAGFDEFYDVVFKPTAHMARTMKNLLSVLRGENTDAETPREVAIVVMTEASTK